MKKLFTLKRVLLALGLVVVACGALLYADYASYKSTAVPILAYHKVDDAGTNEYSVPEKLFGEQMKYLADEGYRTLNLAEYSAGRKAGKSFERCIVLTFDDGYMDNLTKATPIMAPYGFTGSVFLAVKFLAWPGYLDKKGISDIQDAGWEIGSHTFNHVPLGEQTREIVHKELVDSAAYISKRWTRQRPLPLCYPNGSHNSMVMEEVEATGYTVGLTGVEGVNDETVPLTALRRVNIFYWRGDSVRDFAARLNKAYVSSYLTYRGIDVAKIKACLKSIAHTKLLSLAAQGKTQRRA